MKHRRLFIGSPATPRETAKIDLENATTPSKEGSKEPDERVVCTIQKQTEGYEAFLTTREMITRLA
jgi:hypothetical protein